MNDANDLRAEIASLRAELEACRKQLAEKEQELARVSEGDKRYRRIFDTNMLAIAVVDATGNMLDLNQAWAAIVGCSKEEVFAGRWKWTEATPQEHEEADRLALQQLDSTGTVQPYEKAYRRVDGSIVPVLVSAALLDTDPTPRYIACVLDLTERERAHELLTQQVTAEARLHAQEALVRELSTPLIPISDAVMVMPLIGRVDSYRAGAILERLLTGVAESHAQVVILDITGMMVVDTQVAKALIEMAQAVKLLGAQVIVTGIRPDVAQSVVSLGIDLSHITTRNSLQNGIATALRLVRTER
jgi:rsbT co-antagonist protein RsbR